jgi:hypothetical protein
VRKGEGGLLLVQEGGGDLPVGFVVDGHDAGVHARGAIAVDVGDLAAVAWSYQHINMYIGFVREGRKLHGGLEGYIFAAVRTAGAFYSLPRMS